MTTRGTVSDSTLRTAVVLAALLAFMLGAALGYWAADTRPDTVTLTPQQAWDDGYRAALDEMDKKLAQNPGYLAGLAHAAGRMQPPAAPDNREAHPPAATPQPYSLHPGATPLKDPTQDAYYRKLLKEGRFPTSGSAEGRPK